MGPLGFTEILFILVLALLLFGPKKLPELGRLVGRGLAEFRRASADLRATVEDELNNVEREASREPNVPRSPSISPPAPSEPPKPSEPS